MKNNNILKSAICNLHIACVIISSFSINAATQYFLSDDGVLDKPVLLVEGYDSRNEWDGQYYYNLLDPNLKAWLKNTNRDLVVLNFIDSKKNLHLLADEFEAALNSIKSEQVSIYSQWAVSWSITAILLSFSICAMVGLIFGVYPAIKASRLDPIETLQSD